MRLRSARVVSERMCDSWGQTTSAPEEAMRAILACVLLPRSVRLWTFHERTCTSVAGRLGVIELQRAAALSIRSAHLSPAHEQAARLAAALYTARVHVICEHLRTVEATQLNFFWRLKPSSARIWSLSFLDNPSPPILVSAPPTDEDGRTARQPTQRFVSAQKTAEMFANKWQKMHSQPPAQGSSRPPTPPAAPPTWTGGPPRPPPAPPYLG